MKSEERRRREEDGQHESLRDRCRRIGQPLLNKWCILKILISIVRRHLTRRMSLSGFPYADPIAVAQASHIARLSFAADELHQALC